MDIVLYDANKLMRSGVFKTRTDMIHFLMLLIMRTENEPRGSWALKSELETYAVTCSTATVGRYLKELDSREFTLQKGNLGRVPTPAGVAWLENVEDRLARSRMREQVGKAVQVNKYEELLDLLYTRQILETETARLAAQYATDQELEQLRGSLSIHQSSIQENKDPTDPALDFHATVAEISHNKFMSALLNMLFFEERRIESMFDNLVTRERGRAYVQEHENITHAIETRQPDLAAQLMNQHIQVLLDAIEDQADELDDLVSKL